MKHRFLFLIILAALLTFSCCAALADGTEAAPIALGDTRTVTISAGGDIRYFSFTPAETAYYTFESAGSLDTYAHLYGPDMAELKTNDESGAGNNFLLAYRLTANVQYTYAARLYSKDKTGSFTVSLTRTSLTGVCGDQATWMIDGEMNLFINGQGAMTVYNGSSAVPWSLFSDAIKSVTIQNGITSISPYAFYSCKELKFAIIPGTVTEIGGRAFYECARLAHIQIPEGVQIIGDLAFYHCTKLKAATFPGTLKSIGKSAFYACTGLMNVTFPNGLQSIGDYAFWHCWTFTSVSIPGSVQSIGVQAFYELDELQSLTIGEGVRSIGEKAFYYSSSLASVTLPKSLQEIGESAFGRCYSIADFRYGGTLSDWNAIQIFHGNGWLNKAMGLSVADSGTVGGTSWTVSSAGVLTIGASGAMENFTGSSSFGQLTGTSAPWYVYREMVTSAVIQSGVTTIGDYAFVLMDHMLSIQLPSSVTSLGEYAFYRSGLNAVALPSTLKTIGNYAMSDMGNLMELIIPASVTSIGRGAFYFSMIRSVSLPVSVTEIPDYAFYYCSSLATVFYAGTQAQWANVTVGEQNTWLTDAYFTYESESQQFSHSGSCGDNVRWRLDNSGVLTISGTGPMTDYTMTQNGTGAIDINGYNKSYTADTPWYDLRGEITGIVVGSGVTRVGNCAFLNCYRAQYVSLPDGLEAIGPNAFRYMNITSLTMPDSVTSLGHSAFFGCCQLSQISLSKNLKHILSRCFAYCRALHTLVLPEGIESVWDDAFTMSLVADLTIPATVTSLTHDMGLNTGNSRDITVRFLGDVPNGLPGSFLTDYIACVWCRPEYFEHYRDVLISFQVNLNSKYYDAYDLGMLYTGNVRASLSDRALTLTDTDPSAVLYATVNGSTSGVNVTWHSSDESAVRVLQDGTVSVSGVNGAGLVYADAVYNGGRSIVSCKVTFTYSQINAMLLATLPTGDIQSNHIATIAASSVEGYQPCLFVEENPENEYYQELLALTNQLTQGCQSDTEKARAIFSWVGSNIQYSMVSLCIGNTPSQAYWVYYNRTGNCQGFSKLAGYMLSLANIPSGIVTNEGHMWNVVYLEGRWVMLDAQLGSSAFYADYSEGSYKEISTITFSQGNSIYVVDEPGDVKLVGVGTGITERDGVTEAEIAPFATTIYGYALQSCDNLTTVVIPSNITSIGHAVFSYSENLRQVIIPDSVTFIDDTAFNHVPGVTIYCNRGSTAHAFAVSHQISFVLMDSPERVLTLPSAITVIEREAFAGLASADVIVLSENVVSIDDEAFTGTGAILSVPAGSYAEEWAKAHGCLYISR